MIILLSVAFVNTKKEKISDAENRKLADFPKLFDSNGSFNTKLKEEFDTWLNDNIGFRSYFVKTHTVLKVKFLHMSTNPTVHFGNDGWYFYTPDHNLDIAKGTYPLTDEMLRKIASTQQEISDYYRKQNISYFLLLTPSKASIYPEYISGGNYSIRETPIDIVTNYLKTHTTVNVINSKPYLINDKNKGLVFQKRNTHWTTLGSYAAYKAILERMNETGDTDAQPVIVEGVTQDYSDEFAPMLGGYYGILGGNEKAAGVVWNENGTLITSGDFYNEIKNICEKHPGALSYFSIINNSMAKYDALMIYGDSQIQAHLKIPFYMAEHYKTVVFAGIVPTINAGLEAVVEPDTVLFSCSERYIIPRLTDHASDMVPILVDLVDFDVITNLPENSLERNNYGNGGMWIDYVNKTVLTFSPEVLEVNDETDLFLEGWAVDALSNKPLSELYVSVGTTLIRCRYGNVHGGVASFFNNPDLTNTGFEVTIPKEIVHDASEIGFIMVGSDGSYRYKPVNYKLNLLKNNASIIDARLLREKNSLIAEVKVKNTGGTKWTWTENTGIYIASWAYSGNDVNTGSWVGNGYLGNSAVNPGEEYTFRIDLVGTTGMPYRFIMVNNMRGGQQSFIGDWSGDYKFE
jgi:hypothetical protein